MSNKYLMENDMVQRGDIVRPEELSNGKEAWDYFWRNPLSGPDWFAAYSYNCCYSSKDAAKRGISRLLRRYGEGWADSEFIVGKISES